jgi:hypothetical protein
MYHVQNNHPVFGLFCCARGHPWAGMISRTAFPADCWNIRSLTCNTPWICYVFEPVLSHTVTLSRFSPVERFGLLILLASAIPGLATRFWQWQWQSKSCSYQSKKLSESLSIDKVEVHLLNCRWLSHLLGLQSSGFSYFMAGIKLCDSHCKCHSPW